MKDEEELVSTEGEAKVTLEVATPACSKTNLNQAAKRIATRRRRNLERDLRFALRRNEFFLVFQPILSLRDNHISGNEALLRWEHPALGVKTPIELINIIEETGLIHEIGDWVIHEACKTAASWPKDTRVAVNISPTQLRKAGILSCVVNALTESRLPPGCLELEITETALVDDSEFVFST